MEIRIGVQHRRQNPILERPRTGFVTLLIAVKRNKQNFPQLRCDVLRRMLADAIGRMPLGRRPLETAIGEIAIGARQRNFVP